LSRFTLANTSRAQSSSSKEIRGNISIYAGFQNRATSRGDEHTMDDRLGNRAVVLGGSIAGLLAARVLADAYREVVVVDRDILAGVTEPRRAIPQGRHIHALLARGQQILDELFPGFTKEMIEAGVPVGDFGTSLSWYFGGKMIKKAETGLVCVAAGRPLLEEQIRRRVTALTNVTLIEECDILGLTATADAGRITGVRIQRHGPGDTAQTVEADLVVDATGRGSRTPTWLVELGYPRVAEERVKMDLTYTTCDFRGPLPFDPIGPDIALIPVATPAIPRGAIFARLPDRYAVSLTGVLGDRPPTDMDGFLAYVKSLPVPEIFEAVRDATPMGEPVAFHFPASLRRRYERMSRLPERLLVLGDAACVFNPVYGQGMTVAAIEATVLIGHLRLGVPPQPAAFFRDLARVIDAPWDMSAGADLGFPGVEGRRTMKVRMGNAYVPRLQRAAVGDATLSAAFLRVAGLVDPPTEIMRPALIPRVLVPKIFS
jgi:2-polyprenyl-6-methoxyphenol hydroxylase-like FAD-dependent oxidoreductase